MGTDPMGPIENAVLLASAPSDSARSGRLTVRSGANIRGPASARLATARIAVRYASVGTTIRTATYTATTDIAAGNPCVVAALVARIVTVGRIAVPPPPIGLPAATIAAEGAAYESEYAPDRSGMPSIRSAYRTADRLTTAARRAALVVARSRTRAASAAWTAARFTDRAGCARATDRPAANSTSDSTHEQATNQTKKKNSFHRSLLPSVSLTHATNAQQSLSAE